MTICVHCKKKINKKKERYKIVALDKPYINLFFHKKCLEEAEKGEENFSVFLTKNYEMWYNTNEEYKKSRKKRGKRKEKGKD